MTESSVAEELARVPLFADLTQRQLNRVARVTHETAYEVGDTVLREQDVGQKLVLISQGKATVTRQGVLLATVGPGDVVGEMSLIDARPRSASVVAETDLATLVIFRSDFRKVLDDMPAVWERLLLTQTDRLRAANRDLEALG